MRLRLNQMCWVILPALFLVLFFASPALAQGDGSGTVTTESTFKMFFWSGSALGKIVLWILILMSMVTMALVIMYALANRSDNIMPGDTVDHYADLLEEKRFRDAIEFAEMDDTTFGQVMHATLSQASNGYAAMERAIEEQADLLGNKRVRSIELLNVLGAVGPMIGLFGTVYGMIEAFQVIVTKGGQPNPADLADGISTALVTTFWGLIVGIPAVAAAALIRNKIDGNMVEVMVQSEELISQFAPGAKKTAAGGSSSGGGAKPSGPKPQPAAPPKPRPS